MRLTLHDKQKQIVASPARFKVIRAGRKAGKTSQEVESICYKAIASIDKLYLRKRVFPTGRKVLYIAPTQTQARSIIWEALKTRLHGVGRANEQLLQMRVPNEDGEWSIIQVGGWENRENYRGLTDVIHITFDEVDTLRDFFIGWLEIFRPMFLDTAGTANFIGTPKKENPNLRRLEKEFATKGDDFASFKFTSFDNPHLPPDELLALKREYQNDMTTYQQEVMAEYVDNTLALFHYDAIVDTFTNNVVKRQERYLIVDIADDGTDSTIFSLWEDLEEYKREEYSHMNTETIIQKIRELATTERVPYSHIIVDAIGVGAGVASSSLLDGIVGFKSSYQAIATDPSIVRLPNVNYISSHIPLTSDYKNLRSQCVFTLASHINNHQIASRVTGRQKEVIIEELATYQDVSQGDGKRLATLKEDVKSAIGRSPDASDTWIMRMYFTIKERMLPGQSPEATHTRNRQTQLMDIKQERQHLSSNK